MSGRRSKPAFWWACNLAVALTFFGPHASWADTCNIRINAMDITVDPEQFSDGSATATRRERALSWPTRSLSRLRGNTPGCPSNVTLTFLAQLEGLPDTTGYCLAEGDAQSGWLLVPGDRNFRGRCQASTCERVNGTATDLENLTRTLTAFAYGERPSSPETTSVAHASGAVLMSATRSALQRTFETGASAALSAAMSSPTAIAASAITVTAVGGGVWLCSN